MDGSPHAAAVVNPDERRRAGHARAAGRPRPPGAQHRAAASRPPTPPACACGRTSRPTRSPRSPRLQRDAGARGIAVAKVGRGGGVRGAPASTTSSSPIPSSARRSGGGSPSSPSTRGSRQRRQRGRPPRASAPRRRAPASTIRVQIDIDSGFGRCGVADGRPRCDRGARAAGPRAPGPGARRAHDPPRPVLRGRRPAHPHEAGRDEGELLVAAAERLRARGIAIDEISAGGTLSGDGRGGGAPASPRSAPARTSSTT